MTLLTGVGDFVHCVLSRNVYQINWRTQGAGNTNRPAGGFAFDLWGAGKRVRFWPGNALCQQFLLHVIHKLAIFRVYRGDRAQLQAARKALHQNVIGGHDGAFVGHKVLKAVNAVVAYQGAHILFNAFVPPGDGHVKGEVSGGFFRPALPGFKGFQQRLAGAGNHEIDNGGGAARHGGGGAGVKIFAGHCAHKRHLHMGMGVDAAGHYQLVAGIHRLAALGYF